MHPLLPDLTNLSLEELAAKRAELQKKLSWAYQSGNPEIINQLNMAIEDYMAEETARADQTMKELQEKNSNCGNIINIS